MYVCCERVNSHMWTVVIEIASLIPRFTLPRELPVVKVRRFDSHMFIRIPAQGRKHSIAQTPRGSHAMVSLTCLPHRWLSCRCRQKASLNLSYLAPRLYPNTAGWRRMNRWCTWPLNINSDSILKPFLLSRATPSKLACATTAATSDAFALQAAWAVASSACLPAPLRLCAGAMYMCISKAIVSSPPLSPAVRRGASAAPTGSVRRSSPDVSSHLSTNLRSPTVSGCSRPRLSSRPRRASSSSATPSVRCRQWDPGTGQPGQGSHRNTSGRARGGGSCAAGFGSQPRHRIWCGVCQ